jgi:hypothetical protein
VLVQCWMVNGAVSERWSAAEPACLTGAYGVLAMCGSTVCCGE